MPAGPAAQRTPARPSLSLPGAVLHVVSVPQAHSVALSGCDASVLEVTRNTIHVLPACEQEREGRSPELTLTAQERLAFSAEHPSRE